jgi:localization factor PodJL
MSAGAPWSVKGVDPKSREIAKDLARRQGTTVGDLLSQALEDLARSGAKEPVRGRAARPQEPRTGPGFAAQELGRLKDALDRIDARVESAEHRSTLAISGIDQTVLGLLSRL